MDGFRSRPLRRFDDGLQLLVALRRRCRSDPARLVQEIEAALSNAEIIDVKTLGQAAGKKIVFGATVDLYDVGEEKEVTYQIVGELEADIKQNLISITSPIARALIGKIQDDVAVVKAPGGEREYEIVAVRYE